MNEVSWIDWYQSLAKPSWTPAPRTIGLIWLILYPVVTATFGYVFVQAGRGRLPNRRPDVADGPLLHEQRAQQKR